MQPGEKKDLSASGTILIPLGRRLNSVRQHLRWKLQPRDALQASSLRLPERQQCPSAAENPPGGQRIECTPSESSCWLDHAVGLNYVRLSREPHDQSARNHDQVPRQMKVNHVEVVEVPDQPCEQPNRSECREAVTGENPRLSE